MIRVISPGLLATVQDLGRPGYADIGVSASGAADALALRAGNLLAGNPPGAPAIEMTMTGGVFEFHCDAVAALAGAIPVWHRRRVRSGETLRCEPLTNGARLYLCVRGGIAAPTVMGSASAHLVTGLGGKALRRGETLAIGSAAGPLPRRDAIGAPARRPALRVTPGPQSHWFDDDFYSASWRLSPHSDRMGLRLEGPPVAAITGAQLLTEGVTLGAVQVPAGGQPIILFVEHQTTGGYPKIASVISADFHSLAQLRAHDRVAFERVTLDDALHALRRQEEWLGALV
jgi:antagonist of KipI